MVVQLPANGSGTVVDTVTIAAKDRQVLALGDGAAATAATVEAVGTRNSLDVNIAGSAGGLAQVSGTLTGSGVSVSAAVGSAGNVTIAIAGGTYTNLPIAFEASVDSGTNWFTVDATRADGSGNDISPTLPAAAVRAWDLKCPGYTNVRVRQTGAAGAQTVNPTVILAPGPMLYDPSPVIAPVDGAKDTYTFALQALASNIAGDILVLTGSATRTIRLTRLEVYVRGGGTITVAGAVLSLIKRSTADTAGTAGTAPTTGPADSTSPAATATSTSYTAAPTLGTVAAIERQAAYVQQVVAAAAPVKVAEWDFGNRPSKAPVLRGVAQQLAVNNSAAAAGTSPTLTWTITGEFTEEG